MESLPKGESLYLYKGTTCGGGGGNNNNGGGNGGDYGGGGGGGGNGPRERLWKEPREILPMEKREIPFRAPNVKRSISKGNKGTPRYFARLKRIIKYKTRGSLPTARRWGLRANREGGQPKEKGPAGGIIG